MVFDNTSNIRIHSRVFFCSLFMCLSLINFPYTTQAQSQAVEKLPAGQAQYSINALLTDSPVVMDGRLSESDWNLAEPATSFTQREPDEGEPATEKTEVRILYDHTHIYLGVYCYDSEPDRIVHNELRFDGNLSSDDYFTVVLDTFDDKQNAFYFSINPNGARLDAKLGGGNLSDRARPNYDWNGVWDTAARITDDGWSAEIVIPLSTLRFNEVDLQEWGINFERVIARKNEQVLWAAWGRDDGITQLSRAGRLCNLRNISRGKILEIKPFVLGGVEDREGVSDNEFKYGIDVKYPLTSDLTLDVTSLTDFAQIEADRTQINLTRFDLLYPEKRDFFLEGAEIFRFGGSSISTPFYSRRIGLSPDRQAIPILGGAKITGKSGNYNIGVLDMQTDEDHGVPSTNYSVVRVKRDILNQSSIGMIATGLHDDNGYWDRTVGLDFNYNTDRFLGNKNFSITTWFEKNYKESGPSGKHTGQFIMSYPNDLLNIIASYKEADEDYDPEMGFYNRVGVRQVLLLTEYSPRPDIPHMRQLLFSEEVRIISNINTGRLETRNILFSPFGFTTKTEDTFRFTIGNYYDYLYDEFNIFKNVVIPADAYEWWDFRTTFMTNESRPLATYLSLQTGDFYNGTKTTVNTQLVTKFSEFISVASGIIYNKLALGPESFSTQEYIMRVNTNVSPRLAIRTFVQYNNDDELVNLNFRIHFIPQIGSDIFFVYNHNWDRGQEYKTTFDALVAKIAWRFEI